MPISKFRPTFTFTQDRLEQLKAIAPEAFADGKINWESLKQALGEFLEDENQEAEHFGLFWPGKREARRLATMPSKGALVPAPDEGINEDSTGNIFIEGENLEVLKLLQKSYAGQIKMIYIDPPYNTGNDFVYEDDKSELIYDHLCRTNLIDENGNPLTSNTGHKQNGNYVNVNTRRSARFHSNWLNMLYPRLKLAHSLLRHDGIIVISADDTEFANLRLSLNEIFGEENFIGTVIWNSTKTVTNTALISVSHTYNLIFARSKDYFIEHRHHFRLIEPGEGFSNPDNDPRGPWKADPFQVGGIRPNQLYAITNPKTGKTYQPNPGCSWKNEFTVFEQLLADNRIVFGVSGEAGPQRKRFQFEAEERGRVAKTLWDDVDTTSNATRSLDDLFNQHIFDNPKPVDLIKRFVELSAQIPSDAIVLDFFAGSCTTVEAVLGLNREDGGNRRFIMVQLPESTPEDSPARKAGYTNIAEIGKERIRRVIAKMRKEANGNSQAKREMPEDLGFKVCKLTRSNFKAWEDYDGENPEELERLFDQAETPLVENCKEEDLLTEIILQQGFPLDSQITPQAEFKQNTIQLVEAAFCAHRLFICLDGKIKDDTIKRLELRSEDIFVCLDSALTDQAKMRLADVCNLKVI